MQYSLNQKKVLKIFFSLILALTTSSCVSKLKNDNSKKSAELKMEIGLSHLERNNLPLALKELLEADQLDSKNAYIKNNLGLIYFLREKYELSAKYFTTAMSLNSKFTEAKNNLARVYIEQKKYNAALDLLNEVSADLTYTNMQGAYFNYGLLYFNQNKFEQAKKYFLNVLKINREDCYSQVYYSRTLIETRFLKAAAEQLNKAAALCEINRLDDAHYYSAIVYYRLGEKEKSLNRFSEVLNLFPDGKHHAQVIQMIDMIQKENK